MAGDQGGRALRFCVVGRQEGGLAKQDDRGMEETWKCEEGGLAYVDGEPGRGGPVQGGEQQENVDGEKDGRDWGARRHGATGGRGRGVRDGGGRKVMGAAEAGADAAGERTWREGVAETETETGRWTVEGLGWGRQGDGTGGRDVRGA